MSFYKKKYRLRRRSNADQLEPLDLSRRIEDEIPNQCAPKIQISEDLGNKWETIDLQNSTSEPDDKVLLKDQELPKEEHDFNSKIGEDSNRTVSSGQHDIGLGEIAEPESDVGEILQEPEFLASNVSGNSKASVSSRKRSGSKKTEKLNPNWLAKDKMNSKKDVPEILESECFEATQFESKNLKLNDFPTLKDSILESYPTPPVDDKTDGSWFSNILSVNIYRDSDSKKDQAQVLVPKTSENDRSARSRRKSPGTNSSGFGSGQGIEPSVSEHPGNERSELNIDLPMPVLLPQVPDPRNQLKTEVDGKPEQLSGTSGKSPPVLLLKGESQGPESSEIDSSLSVRKYQEVPKLESDGSIDTFLKHVQPSELHTILQFKTSGKSVQTTTGLKRLDSKEQSIEKQSSSAPCDAIFKSTDINLEKSPSSSIRHVHKKQGNPSNSSFSETRLIVSEPSDSDFENASPRSVRIRKKYVKRCQNSSSDSCGEVENLQPENLLSSPEVKTPSKLPVLKDSQHSNSKMERPSTYSVSTRTTPKSYSAPRSVQRTVPKTPSFKSGVSVSSKRRLKDPDLLVPETDKTDNSVHISKWCENLNDPYVLIEPIEESYRHLRENYSRAKQPYLVNEECQASEALESEKVASKSKTLESLLSPKAVQDEHGSSSNHQFSDDLKDRNGVEKTEAGNISSESISSIAVKMDALVCDGVTLESRLEFKRVTSTEKEPPRMEKPMKEKSNLKSPFKLVNKIRLRSEGRVLQSFVDENKLPHKFEDRELKNLEPKRKSSNEIKREKHSKLFVAESFESTYSESINLLEKLDLGSENSLKSEELVVEVYNKFGSEGNPHLDKLNMKSKALKKSKTGRRQGVEVQIKNSESEILDSLVVLEKPNLQEKEIKTDSVLKASGSIDSQLETKNLDQMDKKSKPLKKSKVGRPKKHKVVEVIRIENSESENLDSLIVSEKSNMPEKDIKTNLVLRNRSDGYKILDQMNIKSKPLKKFKTGRPKKRQGVEVQIKNSESENSDSLIVLEKSNLQEKEMKTDSVLIASGSIDSELETENLDQMDKKSKPLKKSKVRRPKKHKAIEPIKIKILDSGNSDPLIISEKSNKQEKEMKTDSSLKASGNIGFEPETTHMHQMDRKSTLKKSKTRPKKHQVQAHQNENNSESANLEPLNISENSKPQEKDIKKDLILKGSGNVSSELKTTHLNQMDMKIKGVKKSKVGRPKKRKEILVPENETSESRRSDSLNISGKSEILEKKSKKDLALESFEKSSCNNVDGTRLDGHGHLEKRRRGRKAKRKFFESSEFPESEHSESVVLPDESKRDAVTKELPSENTIIKAFMEYSSKFKQALDNAMSESEMKNISSTSFTEVNQSGNSVPPPIQNVSSDLDNAILNNISPLENTSTGTKRSKQSVPKALVNCIAEPEPLSANETNYSTENPTSKAHIANCSPKKSNLSSEEHSEPEEYNDDTIIYSNKSESSSPEIQALQTSTTDFIKTRSSRQKELLQHGSVEHSKVKLRICNRCNKCFLHEDDMISHYATTHAKRSKRRDGDRITPTYTKCSVSFVTKVPEEINLIHCSVCDRSLPYTDFKVHTCSCIGQLFFRCTLCICVFYDQKELGNHMYWDHEKNDLRLLFENEGGTR